MSTSEPARPRGRSTPAALTLGRHPAPGGPGLAQLLARAFLDAPAWQRADLLEAGADILGARRRWLGPLVREVLSGYPRRPDGAPRELAAWIGSTPAFREAAAKAAATGSPLAPAHLLLDGDPADPRDLAWLARELRLTPGELDWFADTHHWNRSTPTAALQHYRYQWRPRPGRVPRLLEIPGIRLRTVQRRVLDRILSPLPVHPAAHGFVPGRGVRTHAAGHAGSDVVVSLDLAAFFAHVTPGGVYRVLRRAGYPEATAHTLTGVCTHAVPDRVLRAMPDGGTADERTALMHALRVPHLPQGAPSSPALANLSLRRLDARLTGLAESVEGTYTRYADDLVISGPASLARRADALVRGVRRIVAAEGHALNSRKTRIRGAAVRQTVTGVVVNAHPNIARAEYDALKAVLHNCHVHGPASQGRGHPDLRAHLAGRIAWVTSLNPQRGARLKGLFDEISW